MRTATAEIATAMPDEALQHTLLALRSMLHIELTEHEHPEPDGLYDAIRHIEIQMNFRGIKEREFRRR